MSVSSVTNIASQQVQNALSAASSTNEESNFKDMLMSALDNINSLEQESTQLAEDFAAGNTDSIHEVLIASEKASLSLQFAMQVRNKVLDAYNEIMRMSI